MFHSLTCCGHNSCNKSEHNDGVLIATEEGLICPCGKYKQITCPESIKDGSFLKNQGEESLFEKLRKEVESETKL